MQTHDDIVAFLEGEPGIASVLRTVSALGCDDCWVAAGLIRNAVWDRLHGRPFGLVPGSDVDVIYCDHEHVGIERDLPVERALRVLDPGIPWSVHNQARMHHRNGDPAYEDCADAIRFYPETATAVAARWDGDRVEMIAPLGVADLLGLIVRPTPAFRRKRDIYEHRQAEKNWGRRWPRLTFLSS